MSLDHGELNTPLGKRYGKGGIDAEVDRQLAKQRAEARADWKCKLAAVRQAEAGRVRLIRADIDGATHVRDDNGWATVVRINAKTVTVETAYSWTDRIAFDRILEVRK